MVKGTKVKISAPFMNIPAGENGTDIPIMMDRHFKNNLMNYITEKKLKMIHCKIKDSNVVLEFVDKFEATKFALGYAEIYGKSEPEIF